MTSLHDIIAGPLGQAASSLDPFGLAGMTLGVAASLMRCRGSILLTGAAGGACFSLHYQGLGSATGAALCLVSILQNLGAADFARNGVPRWLGAAFAASALLAILLTLSTWAGWPSGCAVAGTLLATAARLQSNEDRMRALFVGATAFWCAHDVGVGSACALACELLTFLGFAFALLRRPAEGRTAPGHGLTLAA